MTKSMLNKVPAVTLIFWLIKTLATTVGETAADYLNMTLKFGLVATSGLMALLLVIALVVQLWTRRYIPAVYWLVVVLVSVVGTLLSDNLVDNLGVSLELSSTLFAVALAAIFGVWYAVEHTLSVHTIKSTRRELFYWAAILFTFSLGTSAGDLIGEKLGLGYAWSVVLFLALIAAVYAVWRIFKINAVLAFWAAYILTRPLGASTGDLLSQSRHDGGLGSGRSQTGSRCRNGGCARRNCSQSGPAANRCGLAGVDGNTRRVQGGLAGVATGQLQEYRAGCWTGQRHVERHRIARGNCNGCGNQNIH